MDEPPLTMDIATAASRLGVSADWLARQARAGLVPHAKFGGRRRFTEKHLTEIVDQREQLTADPWARSPLAQTRRRNRAAR